MCQTDEKKRRGRFFRPLVFFVLSFPNQNPHQRARAHLKHRFFSSFCASSFFFLLARSIHSSHFSLVARARIYIYIYLETRDLDAFHSRDETRKRERRKENDVHERRRSRRKKGRGRRKIESFFRSGRLRESERRREKEREETRLSSSFQTL